MLEKTGTMHNTPFTVVALYLHLFHAERFPAFEAALDHLRTVRGLDDTQPQPAMLDLARQALDLARTPLSRNRPTAEAT